MFDKKIVFLDIDGTLIQGESQIIPESAIKAIRLARTNGHKVYLNTGHAKSQIYPALWEIGLDGMIGGNGCYIEDNEKVVFHQTFSLEECKKIVDWLKAHKLEFYEESNNGTFVSENFIDLCGKVFPWDYEKNVKLLHKILPSLVTGAELHRDDVNKISFMINSFFTKKSYEDYELAKTELPEFNVTKWAFPGYPDTCGEIGQKNISKGNAVDRLLKYLSASIDNTLAFGDSEVDIPMLEHCKIGVAMGNAKPVLKEMADYVTTDVNDDGIWNAFKHFNLI